MPALQVEDRCVLFVELEKDDQLPETRLRRANFVTVSPESRIRIETHRIFHGYVPRGAAQVTEHGYPSAFIAQKLIALAGSHAIYGEDSRQLSLLLSLFDAAEMTWSWKWKPIGALYVDRLPDHEIAFLSAEAAVHEALAEHVEPIASIVKHAAIYSIARDIERIIGSKDIFDVCAELYRAWAGRFARQAAESLRPLLCGASTVGDHSRIAPKGGRALDTVDQRVEKTSVPATAPPR